MHAQLNRRFKRHALSLVFALLPLGAISVAHAEMPEAPTRAVASSQTAFGALKHVKAGLLDVAYAEVGPATGPNYKSC